MANTVVSYWTVNNEHTWFMSGPFCSVTSHNNLLLLWRRDIIVKLGAVGEHHIRPTAAAAAV